MSLALTSRVLKCTSASLERSGAESNSMDSGMPVFEDLCCLEWSAGALTYADPCTCMIGLTRSGGVVMEYAGWIQGVSQGTFATVRGLISRGLGRCWRSCPTHFSQLTPDYRAFLA